MKLVRFIPDGVMPLDDINTWKFDSINRRLGTYVLELKFDGPKFARGDLAIVLCVEEEHSLLLITKHESGVSTLGWLETEYLEAVT